MNGRLQNNAAIFSQNTTYPDVSEAVTLTYNTWHLHIKKEHPELKDNLNLIQQTIANPAYVAASRPGPSHTHSGNLVFVGMNEYQRNSRLHVFVQSPNHGPTISTALYSKRYHADVLWRSPDAIVRASYDENADVLYLSVTGPVAALTEEGDDGLLRRFSIADDKPVGITVPGFRKAWSGHLTLLAQRVAEFLQLSVAITEKKLVSIAVQESLAIVPPPTTQPTPPPGSPALSPPRFTD